jgi:hypothetical protein
MSGLTAHEWIRATIIADIFHWGVLGLLALAGYFFQRWMKQRAHLRSLRREQYPGSFGPYPPVLESPPEPTCACQTCGRLHFPMPSAEEQREFLRVMESHGAVGYALGRQQAGVGPRIVMPPPPPKKGA